MRPLHVSHRWSVVVAYLALFLAACGDNGTGPGPAKPTDPLTTAANVADLDALFTTPLFQSLRLASSYSPARTSLLGVLRALLLTARSTLGRGQMLSPGDSHRLAMRLQAALQPATSPDPAAILPPELLGKTFEWDTVGFAGYIVTSRQDPDAPTDGVRFILYELDTFNAPVLPLHEFAFADLKDESAATRRLHLVVGAHTPVATYLDYAIVGTATPTSNNATVVGYITDGTRQLEFDAAANSTASAYTLDVRFDVNAANAHARLKATITQPTSSLLRLDMDFQLQFGTEVVTLAGYETLDLNTFDDVGKYTVRVNGGIYATADVAGGTPTFSGGGGQQLTADDYIALNAIYNAVGTIANRFNDLLAPGGSLAT